LSDELHATSPNTRANPNIAKRVFIPLSLKDF
jgi:hypothetical protein